MVGVTGGLPWLPWIQEHVFGSKGNSCNLAYSQVQARVRGGGCHVYIIYKYIPWFACVLFQQKDPGLILANLELFCGKIQDFTFWTYSLYTFFVFFGQSQ